MCEVIGIGSAVYDMLMLVDRFPSEDTKVQSTKTHIQSGGPCSTALAVMSKFGLNTAYMGTLADDNFGRILLSDFEKYQIDTRYIRVVKDCESFHAVVIINPNYSTRTCVWNKGSVPPPAETDVDLEAIKAARYLYLDGHQYAAALFAAQKAREFGVKVVLDAGTWYPEIRDLVSLSDILIPSEEFAIRYSAESKPENAAVSIYEQHQPEILLITQGKAGGLLFDGEKFERYPAFEVTALDTNGAGDVFHGAFVAGHARGFSALDCARFASAVSAIKCQHLGARESLPTFEGALDFLNDRGIEINGNT